NKDKSREPFRRKLYNKNNWRSPVILAALLLVSVFSAIILNNSYTNHTKDQVVEVDMIEKATEKGQKLTLHLSDRTTVTLNSNSSIVFPRTFEDHTREVSVKGEVFFDVVRDEHKPFIVHAGGMN